MQTDNKPYKRRERVGPLIHRKLNELLARGVIALPNSAAGLSIVSVDVSPDFAQAKVYFSVLEADNVSAVEACFSEHGWALQGRLAQELALRRMPKLQFIFDSTLLAASRIDDLLADDVALVE